MNQVVTRQDTVETDRVRRCDKVLAPRVGQQIFAAQINHYSKYRGLWLHGDEITFICDYMGQNRSK